MTHDFSSPDFVDAYDELPLWSATFGLLLFEHLPLCPNTIALDVGYGSGFPLLELAQRLGPGSVVHGLDPWMTAVFRAARKRRQWRVANAHLHIGDAAKMPFLDQSFDLIVSNLGLNNFADARASVAECRRVLRPSGVIALTSNLVGHMRELYEVFESVLVDEGLRDVVPALHAHIEHRATVDKMRTLLGDAGFTVTKIVEDSVPMRFASGSALLHHDFIDFGFAPAWRELVPEEDRERVFAALEQRLPSPLTLTIPRAYVEGTV